MLNRWLLVCRLLGVAVPVVMVVGPLLARASDDDDDDDDDDSDDADKEDKGEQPPVTSGGLFTKATYPQAELERPLTVIGGMIEARAAIDIDVSKGQVFKNFIGDLDVRYGLKDWVELQAGASIGFNSQGTSLYAGVEGALVYDLVDVRVLAEIPVDPEFGFDIALGAPFRYKPQAKVGIVALDKIITFHTSDKISGSTTPDLTLGVGLVYQAAPVAAIIARAEVDLPQFDPDLVQIPATIGAQLSPNNKIDIGIEGRLANVKPSTRFDARFVLLFLQFRM